MKITTNRVEQARDAVEILLDEIGITNYLYDVEPREGQWDIYVECAINDGWGNFQLSVAEEYIVRAKDDAIIHDFLKDEWKDALTARLKK